MALALKEKSRLSQSIAEIKAFAFSAILGGLGVGVVKVVLTPSGSDSFYLRPENLLFRWVLIGVFGAILGCISLAIVAGFWPLPGHKRTDSTAAVIVSGLVFVPGMVLLWPLVMTQSSVGLIFLGYLAFPVGVGLYLERFR